MGLRWWSYWGIWDLNWYNLIPNPSLLYTTHTHSSQLCPISTQRISMKNVRDYYVDYVYSRRLSPLGGDDGGAHLDNCTLADNFRIRTEVHSVIPIENGKPKISAKPIQ